MSTRSLLGSVLLGLLVVACGGDDEDAGASNPAVQSAGPGSSSSGSPASPSTTQPGAANPSETPVVRGPSGSIDETFGVDGFAKGFDEASTQSVVVDAKGNYLVTGILNNVGQGFLARYTPDGKPDTSLDEDGVVLFKLSESTAKATIPAATVPLPSGEILVIGGSLGGMGEWSGCARLMDASGKVVKGFAKDGEICVPDSLFTHGRRLDDGSFLLAGVTDYGIGDGDLFVTKISSAGSVDETFGTNGIARLMRPDSDMTTGLAIDSKSRILVGGIGGPGASLVWRLSPTGQTDPWFGGGVVVSTKIAAYSMSMRESDDTLYLTGSDASDRASVLAIDTMGWPADGFAFEQLPTELPASKNAFLRSALDDKGLFLTGAFVATGETDGQAFSMRLDASGKLASELPSSGFVSYPTLTGIAGIATTSDRAVILGTTKTKGFTLLRVWR